MADKEIKKVENVEPKKEDFDNNFDSIIPQGILESIPIEDRGKFTAVVRQAMFSSTTNRSNPISDKITTEHITQLITKSDDEDKRDRQERKGQQNYNLLLLVISLVFLGFLIVFLKDDKELLTKIILTIISFLGGFGLGKSNNKKE